mmetsp:Transcript_2954/g.9713  ORF Transcript_2954/g.9713 Transcript_2954/m.9713 type:complete len:299 (+) Transcript_2954:473-1369(+)
MAGARRGASGVHGPLRHGRRRAEAPLVEQRPGGRRAEEEQVSRRVERFGALEFSGRVGRAGVLLRGGRRRGRGGGPLPVGVGPAALLEPLAVLADARPVPGPGQRRPGPGPGEESSGESLLYNGVQARAQGVRRAGRAPGGVPRAGVVVSEGPEPLELVRHELEGSGGGGVRDARGWKTRGRGHARLAPADLGGLPAVGGLGGPRPRGRLLFLHLLPAVLEPDLHSARRQPQLLRQAVAEREIWERVHLEGGLEGLQLLGAEGGSLDGALAHGAVLARSLHGHARRRTARCLHPSGGD